MKFGLQVSITVEADSSEEAEMKVLTALDPIVVVADVEQGPDEIKEEEDEESTEETI